MARRLRVALIDDDLFQLTVMKDALNDAGFEVTVYQSPEEGLAALKQVPADLVVTDIVMPGMSGFELLRQFREKGPARRTPFIGVSALPWVQPDIDKMAALMGPFRLLPKPLDLKIFVASATDLSTQTTSAAKNAILEERRGAARVPTRLEVKLHTPHEIVSEFTDNISQNGLFIKSPAPLQWFVHQKPRTIAH